MRQHELVDGARHARQRQQRAEVAGKGDEFRPAIVEQCAIAEAVAAERQAASVGIPVRETERAETARHAGIAEALVHQPQQPRIRRPRQFGACQAEFGAELVAIVDPGQCREQQRPVRVLERLPVAVRVKPVRRGAIDEHCAFDSAHGGPPSAQSGYRRGDAILYVSVDESSVQCDNAGKCAH